MPGRSATSSCRKAWARAAPCSTLTRTAGSISTSCKAAGPIHRSKNRLFRQGPDGRFIDVSKGSGLDIAGYCMGVAIGDVNNDGWPDVLVTQYGGLKLFLNNGNGTFTDVSREAGLDSLLWGTSACFVDYDRDGWLDLVVVNYVQYDVTALCYDGQGRQDYCHPQQFTGSVAKLYRNSGACGAAQGTEARRHCGSSFEDVTVKAGLGRPSGTGLGGRVCRLRWRWLAGYLRG